MNMLIFCKMLILLSLFVSITTSNGVSKSGVDYSRPDCKAIVCEQAHEQAKGLSQLALLDEFVSQTILLLNDLMRNMDGEIEKSAKSLLRYIHPHCDSTQKILSEVIEKQKDKLGSEPRLVTGVKPMAEDDQKDHDGSNESAPIYTQDHYGREQDNNYEEKRTAGVSESNQWSSSYDSGNIIGQKSVSDYDDSDYQDRSEENKFSGRGWSGQWRGVEKVDEQKGYKWSNSHSRRSDTLAKTDLSSQSRKGKVIQEEEIVEKHGSEIGFKICRGVNRGSVFWVPGIDQWCQENCSNGYCPKTHCIC